MNLFGLVPEITDSPLRDQVEVEVSKWLIDSGFDADEKVLRCLSDLGIRGKSVWVSLAQIKSLQKYKYLLMPESLHHILDLAESQSILQKLIQNRPYLLAKAGMVYEHAPSFIFKESALLGKDVDTENLDACLIAFATNYTSKFWEYSSKPQGEPISLPHQVLTATFWDSELWHPAAYIEKAYQENILGVEYYVDFHPFNLNKLLPEDFSMPHRDLIREWVEHLNMELSIHTAIVGPYSTPNYMGEQLFYDPVDVIDIQKETVLLAKDVGATSLVLHLVDPDRLYELAEIIEIADGSDIRVTLENYYSTEKINQTSDQFIAVLESLIPLLTKRTREMNLGVTFDPGHYNIEGEDPVVAASRVGRWCKEKGVHLTKVHATTNYGMLRCFPPNFSADVHDRISNCGINNRLIIQILQSIGHSPLLTAEQIEPLIERDTMLVDDALQDLPEQDYEEILQKGTELLTERSNGLITPRICEIEAYQFVAGFLGVSGLQEHLVYRKIQETEQMTSETAKATTLAMMNTPIENQRQAITHVSEMLDAAIQAEGGISQGSINQVCERLSSSIFTVIHRKYLDAIFSEDVEYQAGETICDEGTDSCEMFYIKQGWVHVFIARQQIATLEPNEIFGEIGLFYGVPRSATVKAATNETTLGVLKKESLVALVHAEKDSARAILLQLYSILPERLRKLSAKYARALKTLQSIDPSYAKQLVDNQCDESLEIDDAFRMITLEELEAPFAKHRFYEPGEVVFHENAHADGVYIVKSGSVRSVHDLVIQGNPFGMMAAEELEKIFDKDQFYIPEEQVFHENIQIAQLGRGSIFGEMALIDDLDWSATIVSNGATLGYLSNMEFNRILRTDVELSYNFMLALCSTMMSRIRQLNQAYLQV